MPSPPVASMLLAALLAAGQASAQDARPAPAGGTLSGRVLEAGLERPIADVTLLLEPAGAGAFPAEAFAGAGFFSTSRVTLSDSSGWYHFEQVPAGRYVLHAVRAGYLRYSVELGLPGSRQTTLSIGLTVAPVPLPPVALTTWRVHPYLRHPVSPGAPGTGLAALIADGGTIAIDAVELRHEDVVQGVTLAEPDLFRALQRLPGISTRSDYTAELWTRGAPWDQTRVYFDGVPVFNPLHGLGAFSGISPGAVGAIWLHPGVQPTGLGGGAAGSVDVRTRQGQGEGELNAAAAASLVSATVTLDQRVADGRAAWMLTGRRTYLDWLSDGLARISGREETRIPYAFADLTGRVDLALGGHTLEASGLWQRDRFSGEPVAGAPARPASWGSHVGRVTLGSTIRGAMARHTLAFSEHSATVRDSAAVPMIEAELLFPPETESEIEVLAFTGVWSGREPFAQTAWSGGYGVERYAVGYHGLPALPLPRFGTVGEEPTASGDSLSMHGDLIVGSAWIERLWQPRSSVLVQAGIRGEVAPGIAEAGAFRAAPRLSVRYQPASGVTVAAGWGRSYQYAHALAPSGVQLASLSSTLVWMLSGSQAPALTSDVFSGGLDAWLGDSWRASAHVFRRHTRGVVLPDPRPAPLHEPRDMISGKGRAEGIEVGIRRPAGVWTASASYSLSVSETEMESLRFPASADRRHVVDATAMVGIGRGVRAGAAFTGASGIPFTKILYAPDRCEQGAACPGEPVPWMGPPNAARARPYASVDLLLDWTGTMGRFEIGGYVQLRNAFDRDNGTMYIEARPGCIGDSCGPRLRIEERREPGLPRLPVVGIRAGF